MKKKPPKRKVLSLFGDRETGVPGTPPPGAASGRDGVADLRNAPVLEELPDGSLDLFDLPDPVPGVHGGPENGISWESALSGAERCDTDDLGADAGMDPGIGVRGSGSRGTVLRLFGQGDQKTSAYWPSQGGGYGGADLNDLLELLAASVPFGADPGDGEEDAPLPAMSFPTLDRIIGRLATAISRRLYGLTTRRWTVTSHSAKRAEFAAWSRFNRPVASTLHVYPLEGVALMGVDGDLVHSLSARLMDRGPERRFPERERTPDDSLSPSVASQAMAAYCLHVFQLDVEWAMAPFFEVETSRGRLVLPDDPIIEFAENEECVISSFTVSDGEHAGRIILLFSAAMLRPLEMLLASSNRVLMPASTETDDEVFLRLRTLSDADLRAYLAEAHPLLASVVLFQMSEDRRLRILQEMGTAMQEELVRRMGRRASVLRTLSLEQRVAVRCLLMGEGHTSHMLRMCTPEAAARFLGTISSLPSLFPSQAAEICGEENPGLTCGSAMVVDKGLVGRLLMRSFSPEVFPVVSRLLAEGVHALPFDCLAVCDPVHIATLLGHESYGVCGLVLRNLLRVSRTLAATVFALLGDDAQPAVLERVLMPRSVDVDVVHVVESALCGQLPMACTGLSAEASLRRDGEDTVVPDGVVLLGGLSDARRRELVLQVERHGVQVAPEGTL